MAIPHDLPKLDDQWVLNILKVDLHFASFCYLSARRTRMSYLYLCSLSVSWSVTMAKNGVDNEH